MAGEWIKMRTNLWDDPRVSQVCDMTGAKEAAVIGALYWLWASADEHTEDGFMPGLSKAGIDRKTGIAGFGESMTSIGWIKDGEGGITICNFSDHNGASAKRRAADAQRKANSRNLSASEADMPQTNGGQNAPDCGAREEKRIEEKNKDLKTNTTPSAVSSKFDFAKSLSDAGVPEKHIASWLKVRKAKRGVNTEEAYAGFVREATVAGLTIPDAVLICVERSWAGIKADWLQSKAQMATVNSNSPLGKHGQATAENARRWLESQNESERTAT